ncbi:unnamed protein product [Adineta ricciae]|uniref:Uncharacterized protein n=1 Tax=Adineta ricciae TaxID=249248 RepID=A0A815CD37_ADIRI|nr:unnamed protein product [Adineta ricciae]
MVWLLVSFVLISQLSTTLASYNCRQCSQTFALNIQLGQVPVGCPLKNGTSTICVATLRLDFAENNAAVTLDGLLQESLNDSNGTRLITHSTKMRFDTSEFERTVQVYCFSNDSCFSDISYIHDLGRRLQVGRSRAELQPDLYNSSHATDDLSCDNNQNQTIPCPNGLCQLIYDGESQYIRNCIPNGFSVLPPGIFIASSMIDSFKNESSFIYICNRNRCNNMSMARKVRQTLKDYGLLEPFYETPIYVLETTTTTATTTTAETTTTKSKGITMEILPGITASIQLILFLVFKNL